MPVRILGINTPDKHPLKLKVSRTLPIMLLFSCRSTWLLIKKGWNRT